MQKANKNFELHMIIDKGVKKTTWTNNNSGAF
jgi:hypothetical protein